LRNDLHSVVDRVTALQGEMRRRRQAESETPMRTGQDGSG
jgi:hypothetical protein